MSDNDCTNKISNEETAISHLFDEMNKIQLVEKGKVYPVSVTEAQNKFQTINPESDVYDYTDIDLDIDFPVIKKKPSNEDNLT